MKLLEYGIKIGHTNQYPMNYGSKSFPLEERTNPTFKENMEPDFLSFPVTLQ
ncbi:1575_t:CDS:1, partial [Funneliformis geosporum]